MLSPPELLDAVAGTLRRQVGPAVEDPFAKTQAFMAAVVLEKLAGQLRAADAEDGRADVVADLLAAMGEGGPDRSARALDDLRQDGSAARWRALVEALYADRSTLGPDRFDALLGRVRSALRVRLDHALSYAS